MEPIANFVKAKLKKTPHVESEHLIR